MECQHFLERFVQHIVPERFHRIRHLGFLSTRNKTKALACIGENLKVHFIAQKPISRAEILTLHFGERFLLHCKQCGGILVVWETYQKARDPPPQCA